MVAPGFQFHRQYFYLLESLQNPWKHDDSTVIVYFWVLYHVFSVSQKPNQGQGLR